MQDLGDLLAETEHSIHKYVLISAYLTVTTMSPLYLHRMQVYFQGATIMCCHGSPEWIKLKHRL